MLCVRCVKRRNVNNSRTLFSTYIEFEAFELSASQPHTRWFFIGQRKMSMSSTIFGEEPICIYKKIKKEPKSSYNKDSDSLTFKKNYLTVTDAPTSSNAAFNASASSLATPSLTAAGALSTKPLASFSPKPVASRTALITLTF